MGTAFATKRLLAYVALSAAVALTAASCSRQSVGRIAKSGDRELIYKTALKFYEEEKWKRASDLFEACQGYYIGHEREDSIAFFCARSKYKHRDYGEAQELFDEFRRKFGRSVFIEDAESMYAMCQYYMSPGPKRDQTQTAQAIVSLTEFVERYPDSKRVEAFKSLIEELTLRLHEKTYLNAYTYFKIEKYKSAVVAFRNALKRYADTSHREDILYYIVVSQYRLAHNSIEAKQADRYLELLDYYYSFIEEFPESKHVKEVERYAKEAKNYIDKNNIDKQQ